MFEIFKDSKLKKLDKQLDKLFIAVPDEKNLKFEDNENISDLMKNFFKFVPEKEIESILKDVSVSQPRIARYGIYDEMNKIIPIIKNILQVYTSNILMKNRVDNRGFIFSEDTNVANTAESEEKTKTAKKISKDIVEHFKIFNMLRKYVEPRKLLYGDCFVEVVNIKNIDVELSNMGLINEQLTMFESEVKKKIPNNSGQLAVRLFNILVEIENPKKENKSRTIFDNQVDDDDENITKKNDEKKEKEKKKTEFKDILVKVHKPHNIIILQTKYDSTLGYLEVNKTGNNNRSVNFAQRLSNAIGQIGQSNNGETTDDVINKLIKNIVQKVLSDNANEIDEEVYDFIKRIMIEQGLDRKHTQFNPIKVRFIPPDQMVHFTNVSTEYSPYGESVIENLILPCKLYLLTQLSNIITKLARAPLFRKWTLDVGSTQMPARTIEQFKRELYNTRVTLSDYSNLKTIPKILSDMKDLFLIKQQGTTPVDVDIQSLGDTSIKC